MIIHTPEERQHLVEAGKRLGVILEQIATTVAPGVTSAELNEQAQMLILAGGDEPSFLGYTPDGAARPYPAALCVSINDEVVHGIPNESPRTLALGDIVALDLGLTHHGFVVDSAITVAVGETDAVSQTLMATTQAALRAGIAAAKVGARVGDISAAIEHSFSGTPFSLVRVLGGHGVGEHVHEEPYVPNIGHPGTGEELTPGMVLALEPIANAGKAAVTIAPDGYTYRTKDGSRSAHFEHTILMEENGTTILTRRPGE